MLYLSGTETKYGQTLFGEPQQRKHPDKGLFAWWNYRQNLWYLKISREIKLTWATWKQREHRNTFSLRGLSSLARMTIWSQILVIYVAQTHIAHLIVT